MSMWKLDRRGQEYRVYFPENFDTGLTLGNGDKNKDETMKERYNSVEM